MQHEALKFLFKFPQPKYFVNNYVCSAACPLTFDLQIQHSPYKYLEIFSSCSIRYQIREVGQVNDLFYYIPLLHLQHVATLWPISPEALQ